VAKNSRILNSRRRRQSSKNYGIRKRGCALSAPGVAGLYSKRSPGLHGRSDPLVKGTQASHVLCVERTKGCRDRGPDSDDTLFRIWPKKRNPKFAAKKELRAAHRRRASWTRCAIILHLLECRSGIVRDATTTGGVSNFIHPPLQRRNWRDWM